MVIRYTVVFSKSQKSLPTTFVLLELKLEAI